MLQDAKPDIVSVCSPNRFHFEHVMAALVGTIGVFYGSAYVVVFTFLSWTYGIYAMTGDRSLRPLWMRGL